MSILGHPGTPRSKPRGVVCRGEGCGAALPPLHIYICVKKVLSLAACGHRNYSVGQETVFWLI